MRRRRLRPAAVASLVIPAFLAWASPAPAQSPGADIAPEAPSGLTDKPAVTADRHMIVAAHPAAAAVGLDMLRADGSAVDAAIAAQLVLGLVEPQSSGLGGGGFALTHHAPSGRLESWDGRETAPLAAGADLFLDERGAPLGFWEAVVGGRSVGAPGLVAMLAALHDRYGRLAWADLFEPAIALAEAGFPVSPRLHALIARDDRLKSRAAARTYFHDADGAPWPVGHILTNRAYAETLRLIAQGGAEAFYSGPLAEAIVAAVREDPDNPGRLAAADLAGYRALMRPAVCQTYRGHGVCGMGPPSSGGLTVGQILEMLEPFDLAGLGADDPRAWHLIAEASRLAFADRARYMADRDFVPVPVRGLLDPAYLAGRARLIDPARAMGRAPAGSPPGPDRAHLNHRAGRDAAMPATTHLSAIDARGLAVSMTTSVESAFGSRLMVGGFLLNNQLTDFSFRPANEDGPIANRVEPGKRPRSSMSPTLIFAPDGGLRAILGSPGGSRIIGYVAKTVVALLDWGMAPQAAVALGHAVNRNGPTDLEAGTAAAGLADALSALGHEVRVRPMTSGLHAIAIGPGGRLVGGADPRREGVARGD